MEYTEQQLGIMWDQYRELEILLINEHNPERRRDLVEQITILENIFRSAYTFGDKYF